MSYMVLPLNFGTPIWVHLFCCLCLGFPGEWLKSPLLPAWPVLRDGTEYPRLFSLPGPGWATGCTFGGQLASFHPALLSKPNPDQKLTAFRCVVPRPGHVLLHTCPCYVLVMEPYVVRQELTVVCFLGGRDGHYLLCPLCV